MASLPYQDQNGTLHKKPSLPPPELKREDSKYLNTQLRKWILADVIYNLDEFKCPRASISLSRGILVHKTLRLIQI
ncbi:hypothetical protein J6590_070280 [Homalodisca vitripennis]|nr:hypothetical protein J6590_070280 [Homalodisca vitripennis]